MQKKHLTNFNPFMILIKANKQKTSQKKEQSIYQKPPTDITTNGKEPKYFPLHIRIKHSQLLFIIVLVFLTSLMRQEKKTKEYRLGRNKTAPYLQMAHDCLHRKSQEISPKLRISKFSKVTGYKTNMQNSSIFVCSHEHNMKILDTIPLIYYHFKK